MSYPDLERGTGRTQFMIDQLCDAVAEGQPRSLVIGHSEAFCRFVLMPRIIDALRARGFACSEYADRSSIRVLAEGDTLRDASVILVVPACYRRVEGLSGWGKFFDHHADNQFPERCNYIDAVVR